MKDLPIPKLLFKFSLPVMLALLIQSIYNVVDSYFVGKDSLSGLTALSIVFPIQLLMTAVATGTGTGLNIMLSRLDGNGKTTAQNNVIKSGIWLGAVNFVIFTVLGLLFIGRYYAISSSQPAVQAQGIQYARIIFLGSFGLFMESNFTKLLQARGHMIIPMLAQVIGALINIIGDPILIFGLWEAPKLGIGGAAIATITGQWVAMGIVCGAVLRIYPLNGKICMNDCVQIYKTGFPSILMQSLYTLYIVGLNLILKNFTEDAVTVLGIYYKLQTFFFIPLLGLQQVIVPVISFNYGAHEAKRVADTLKFSMSISTGVMLLGTVVFMIFPKEMLSVFTSSSSVINIGVPALRIIAVSFVPAGFAMILTVYFQGINEGRNSIFITILRQIILMVPLAWVFHFAGLNYVWFTFPVTEMIAVSGCMVLYFAGNKKKDDH